MLPEIAVEAVAPLPLQTDPFAGALAGELFLVARLLFGGVLAFMGLNHFQQTDALAGYAEAKGLPAPRLAVLASGGTLVFGGAGVALGVLPALAAGALALFFLVVTPAIHDFWAAPADRVQEEMTQFLKNAALFAVALGLLALSGTPWPYAVGVGL